MKNESNQTAIFAAGCFWSVEEKFYKLPGVISTRVGYTGGTTKNPTYEQVCENLTGHAEAVEITYDEKKISYNDLLHIFWQIHDPTTPNQQGADIGPQYRSVIFYKSEHQKEMAEKSKRKMEQTGLLAGPIITQIKPATQFYEAEKYHQKYFLHNPNMSCPI
jgi:methionine-S-sulfoxide reductase